MTDAPAPKVPLARLMRRLFWPYRGRIAFFAACIALGVGSLFAVTNLLSLVERGIYERARELMASDLSLSSWRPFEPDTRAKIADALSVAGGLREAETVEMASMVRPEGDPTATPFLVTVKAVPPPYPLHGDLAVAPAGARDRIHDPGERACLVSEAIRTQRGLSVGDTLRLGDVTLTIAGVIQREPDRGLMGALSFAPRLMISPDTLEAAGLVKFGARVRRRLLYAVGPEVADPAPLLRQLQERLDARLDTRHVQVQTYVEAQPRTRDVLERVAMFFAMVALVTLVLAIIGVVVGVLSLLNDHLEVIATLRAMGVDPPTIRRAYTWLLVLLGGLGSVAGVAVGYGLDAAVLAALRGDALGLEVGLSWLDVGEALALGLIIALGFNRASVSALARLTPTEIFSDTERALRLRRRDVVGLTLLGVALVAGYLLLETRSIPSAVAFTAGLAAGTLACLAIIAVGFVLLRATLAVLRRGRPGVTLRHGLLSMLRHRRRSLVYLLTLGLGLSLTTSLLVIQHSLERELRLDDDLALPNLFLIDIQRDQVASVREATRVHAGQEAELSPMVRARLTHIRGERVGVTDDETLTPEARQRARMLSREYNLTYKDALGESERVIAGAFWEDDEATPQLSLEERYAGRLGVEVGDTLTFDIQGRPLSAPITSIRRVTWLSLRPNFFVVLPTVVLAPAPQTIIGSVRIEGAEAVAALQRTLFERHPNVSVIDLAPIFRDVRRLLSYVAGTLQGLAALCALVGLLILLSTLQLGRRERLRSASILRALGLSTRQLVGLDVVEYLAVGIVATVTVLVVSLGFAGAVVSVMHIGLHVDPAAFTLALAVPLLLPLLSGLAYNAPGYRRSAQAGFGHSA